MTEIDLTICQECGINPAVYGDGLTWALCSKCKRIKDTDEGVKEEQKPVGEDGFKHEIVPGLTSIIIPVHILNYSLFHYTGNCIGSVREHTKGEYEIVVVDNGSPMKPPSNDSYYAQKVIVNSENLGVTHAWNQGIRSGVGEYIVLLNNDVQVFDDWMDGMKEYLNSGYDLVMAHPMYSMTEPFARAVEAHNVLLGMKEFDPIKTDFSCVMFKRSLLDELGLFDERFFNYCSDLDLFKRMDQAGKKYKVLDHVATSHLSDATGMLIKTTPQIMEKDKAAFAGKWKNVPSVDPVEEVSEVKKSDLLFRVINGGDPLYYLTNNKMYRIKNPETLKALGFDFGQEQNITREEFNTFERGGEISREDIDQIIQHEKES